MTQRINIQIPAQSLNVPLASLLGLIGEPADIAPVATGLPTAIGAQLQGGIYLGPIVENGKIVHLIGAADHLGNHGWSTATKKAREYRAGGFEDWRLPTQKEAMVAFANAQELFEDVYHWTSSLRGEYPWAVGFEHGYVGYYCRRSYEFRVRPFRRFTA